MYNSRCEIKSPEANIRGLVLVEFKGHRREFYSNPFDFPFNCGDLVILEADRGQDAGFVKHCLRGDNNNPEQKTGFSVIRRATLQDKERHKRLATYEDTALESCKQKSKTHELQMKMIDAECRFDGMKLTFYFSADGRIDFRELVKDLAGTFRTRIELRQIGARDESKRSDSYGICGKRLCCVQFLNSFRPITTQMAKDQELILNPSKLSGRCGRLKCCLAYEYEGIGVVESTKQVTIEVIEGEDITEMSD